MKKTIYFLLVSIICISCQEDELNPDIDKKDEIDLTLISNSDQPSTLKFDDAEQMLDYINSKDGDDAVKRTMLEDKNNFQSFREIYQEAMIELDEVENIKQHEAFLKKYKDIVSVVDSTYVPRIKNPLYQKICNREGIYVSEGYAHKVMDSEYMIITESEYINKLRKINSKANLDSEIFRIAPYNSSNNVARRVIEPIDGGGSGGSSGGSSGGCGSSINKNYYNNNSKCRDDRKVFVSGLADFIISGNNYTPTVYVQAYGEKRSAFFCNWNNYKTSLATRDCSYRITVTMNGQNYSYSESFPDQETTSDALDIVIDEGALTDNPIYWQGGAVPTIEFTRINLKLHQEV